MNAPYKTGQRKAIAAIVREAGGKCLSAPEIYALLPGKTSLSTVYRTLRLLGEEGLVKTELAGGGGTAYRYCEKETCEGHFHLRCVGCGELVHLECRAMEELRRHVEREHAFALDPAQTVLYGLCAACRRRKGKKP